MPLLRRHLLAMIVFCFCATLQCRACYADLMAGDVAVIGLSGDSPEFSWVALVDIAAGEQIYFSDAGYDSGSNAWQGTGSTNEWLLQYTTPLGGLTAGTVLTAQITGGIPADYAVFGNTSFGGDVSAPLDLSSAGDQVVAFQSSNDPTLATFGNSDFTALFHLDAQGPEFSYVGATSDFTTDLAPGLTNGVNAVGHNDSGTNELDNIRYAGPRAGSRNSLLAAIANDANWEGTNSPVSGGYTAAGGAGGSFVVSVPEPGTCCLAAWISLGLLIRRRRPFP